MREPIEGFAPVEVPDVRWPVYRDGAGPPVVVFHELNGLTDPVIAFARRLVDAGFTVYLPVLVRPAPARGAGKQVAAFQVLCVTHEITRFLTGRTSRAVKPLRKIARWAAEQAGTTGAGVVGMCFSGGFALAAACDERVLAGVAAQPSLPFGVIPPCARDLGMSPGDVVTLQQRLRENKVEVYVTRFTADRISPSARTRTIERVLKPEGNVTIDELPSDPGNEFGFTKKDHSVLSLAPTKYEPDTKAGQRLQQTFADVVAMLHRRLG